jgi:hypothetical protein
MRRDLRGRCRPADAFTYGSLLPRVFLLDPSNVKHDVSLLKEVQV